jgi:hypothetical protein
MMTQNNTSKRKPRPRKKKSQRPSRQSNDGRDLFADISGDNPPRTKVDVRTISRPGIVPRVTDIYVCRQVLPTITVTAQPTAVTNPTFYFQLSNLPNATAFENLFDQYRIDAIRMTIQPQENAIGLFTNSTTSVTPLYSVIDYDNDSAITSSTLATSYQNCVILQPGKSCERTFVPRVAVATYGGAFTAFGNMDSPWIDSASPSTRLYGIKIFVGGVTAAQTTLQSWSVDFEYFMSFKSLF